MVYGDHRSEFAGIKRSCIDFNTHTSKPTKVILTNHQKYLLAAMHLPGPGVAVPKSDYLSANIQIQSMVLDHRRFAMLLQKFCAQREAVFL